MPNDSRDLVLARIRSSIQQSRQTVNSDLADPRREYRRSSTLDREQCLLLFAERLREYDASVTFAQQNAVAEAIAAITAPPQAQPPTEPQPSWIVADGFPAPWLPSTLSIQWEPQATVDDLNQCSGVISTCSAGIALTGSIVLQHGPGEGRRQTSLLPDRHLCIIHASQVVETVPEAFDRLAAAATRPLTFISGPSATADIEMTRIRGVHGPRHLDVVILNM